MDLRKVLIILLAVVVSGFVIESKYAGAAMPDEYLLMLEEGADPGVVTEAGGTVDTYFEELHTVSARLSQQAYLILRNHPSVKLIERDTEVDVGAQRVGWESSAINAGVMWDEPLTGKNVRLGIIDSGISPHSDLKIAGGASFIDYTQSFHDDHGHGTHVAGIAAALNNNFGVRGVAPDVELYALKAFSNEGKGRVSSLVNALQWAIDHDLDLVNMSLGTQADSNTLKLAIERASKELLVVTSAGNDGTGAGDTVDYPAAYPQTIAVAAIDENLRHASFSSTGPAVDISAPGVSIVSTYRNGGYARMSGTSMAAPYVSGMAALLMEAYPDAEPHWIREQLQKNARDLGEPGRDPLYGYGLLQGFDPDLAEPAKTPASEPEKAQAVNESAESPGYEPAEETPVTDPVNESPAPSPEKEPEQVTDSPEENPEEVTDPPEEKPAAEQPKEITEQPAAVFTDVPEKFWAFKEVMSLYQEDILNGYTDGTFRPNSPIRRDHVALLLEKSITMTDHAPFKPFTDVPASYPFYDAIMKGQQAGIFHGNSDGSFGPKQLLTRAQMAKILVTAFDLKGTTDHPFSDIDDSHWAHEYIAILYQHGITTGSNGKYLPDDPVTRAQYAAFLYRAR